MCIAIIQKSRHKKYAYFVAINREEQYNKKWLDMDFHWQEYPCCKGYLDLETGGTWMAHNNKVLALLINKELNHETALTTRAFIVLESLKNTNSAFDAIKKLSNLNVGSIRPFNVLFIDSKEVLFASNIREDKSLTNIDFQLLNNDLMVVNRTFPNDLSQVRIKNAINTFEKLSQPDPESSNWAVWENELTKVSVVVNQADEQTLWLKSAQWGTLQSDIIAISNNGTDIFNFHQISTPS